MKTQHEATRNKFSHFPGQNNSRLSPLSRTIVTLYCRLYCHHCTVTLYIHHGPVTVLSPVFCHHCSGNFVKRPDCHPRVHPFVNKMENPWCLSLTFFLAGGGVGLRGEKKDNEDVDCRSEFDLKLRSSSKLEPQWKMYVVTVDSRTSHVGQTKISPDSNYWQCCETELLLEISTALSFSHLAILKW